MSKTRLVHLRTQCPVSEFGAPSSRDGVCSVGRKSISEVPSTVQSSHEVLEGGKGLKNFTLDSGESEVSIRVNFSSLSKWVSQSTDIDK